jgi:D-alanine---D-serine ligase
MNKKTIAVLFGGHSTEYEVSLQSACSVIENLDPEKYDVMLLGITRQGEWKRYGGDLSRIRDDSWSQDASCVPAVLSPDRNTHGILILEQGNVSSVHIDVAFPVLHGKDGEDGTIQGLFALAGIPYVGCGTLSSALCMDKDMAHRLVNQAGIKTPKSVVLDSAIHDPAVATKLLRYPLFVKPVNAGSSFGISKITAESELESAVAEAFRHDRKVIVEQSIDGFEVGCAVIGNETLTIGEVDEIELSQGFFDYTEKYTLKTSKIHMPARIDKDTADHIRDTAAKIYRILECRGCARVDMFLTSENEIVFNEVNTIPGFTSHSRYPNMLKGIGMSFPNMLDQLIELAVK